MEFRRIKQFEITVEDGIATHIVKTDNNNSRVPAQAYKFDKKLNCYVKQSGVKFTTLKSGLYKGIYQVF